MYVISGSTHQRLGASLAEEMDAEFCGVVNRHFPDGERYIRVLMDVNGQDVVVVQNTFPDKKIVELLLILQAVKEAGAKTITCVIPYMGYSRQERIFQSGEARSAKAIASVIGGMCTRADPSLPACQTGEGSIVPEANTPEAEAPSPSSNDQ